MLLFLATGVLFTAALYGAAHYVWVLPERERAEALAERVRELRLAGRRSAGGDLVRRQRRSAFAFFEQFIRWLGLIRRLQDILDQANLRYRAGNIAALIVFLAGAGYLLAALLRIPLLFIRALFALFWGSLPLLYILWKRRRRLRRFEAALPDAIDLFARAMRAGHNIHSGLEVVASETYDPVRMEFRKVMEELALGSQVDEALRSLARRVPLVDLHFFVTGVVLQRQTGANVVGVLENLSLVIRERLNMAARLKAHTAQQRLSALVMIIAPVVTGVMFYFLKPDYIEVLWTDPIGNVFFIYAICSEILGALVLWRIASMKF
jgi:tight adherence protein B